MNRRQKIIVSVVGIFIVLLALVGITYGYFLTRIQGNTNTTSITVTTADLKLVYGDGNNIITGTNIEPGWTTNGQNGNPDAKTFTIKNEGNAPVENFNIYLEDVINSLSRKGDLIYTIECENTTVGATSTTCEDFEVVENEVNSENELVFPSVMSIIARDTLDPATATTNAEEHTYTITVTYKEAGIDQSEDMNKAFSAKVNIYDAKTKFLATEIMTNVRKTGTFNYNKTEYIDPSLQDGTIYTIPAEQISSISNYKTTGEVTPFETSISDMGEYASKSWYYYDMYEVDPNTGKFTLSGKHSCTYDSCFTNLINKYLYNNSARHNSNESNHLEETQTNLSMVYKVTGTTATTLNYVTILNSPNEAERLLVHTIDDYGTSYYYRGEVEDNYVNFAGMCWRIIRIQGDGSIKLILEDQYTTCDDATLETVSIKYTGAWDIEASNGSNITMNGSSPYRTGNFGFEDSNGIFKISYLNPVNNGERAMSNAFKYFQTNTLTNKISLNYNGKKISDFLVSGNWCLNNKAYSNGTLLEKPDYSLNMDYDSDIRLYTENKATLKCPVETMVTFKDTTPMYVGTVTADEIVYAGGKNGSRNLNYYLINIWQSINHKKFWTLSPQGFYIEDAADAAFNVNYQGILQSSYVDNKSVEYGLSFRPAISLKSSTTILAGGEGTINNPYVIA